MTLRLKIEEQIHVIEDKESSKTLCGIEVITTGHRPRKKAYLKISEITCMDCFAKQYGLTRITIPCYGIEVLLGRENFDLNGITNIYGSGSIHSKLHKKSNFDKIDNIDSITEKVNKCDFYNDKVHVIETMILEHAKRGVDITTDSYVKGIKLIVESSLKNLPE